MKEKISIVVPIYNVEKYLKRCLKSIVDQTYNNLEIILIDDGSTDNCPEICEEWAKQDSRIKVVHKKNKGLGMARNTGIDFATGKYICFIDSDDYIELDTIEKAYGQAINSQADIVYFGYKDVDTFGNVIKVYKPDLEKSVYKEKDIYEEFLPELISPDHSRKRQLNLMLGVCASLFSLDVIQRVNWRFVSEREIISEDSYSLMKLFPYVKCIAVVQEAFYYYCRNEGSLMRTYRKDRYDSIKFFYNEIIKLCDCYGYSMRIKERFGSVYLGFVINALKLIMLSNMSFKEKLKNINDIVKDSHLKSTLSTIDFKIESNRRKIMLSILIKRRTILCYFVLYVRCKLKG